MLFSCSGITLEPMPTEDPIGRLPKEDAAGGGAVATAFPDATQAGLAMLQAGGNAVDAAVAASWALAVCEPSSSGLGGSAVVLFRSADGKTVVLDGHSRAPAAVSKKTVSRSQQTKGYRACTIPSMVATIDVLQARHGLLDPGRVMEPAIHLAENGYPVTKLQHRQQRWSQSDLLDQPEARRLFLRNGEPLEEGDVLRQPELAATLRRLARAGADDFYRGRIAREIAEDMAANGGLLTREDLADFRPPAEGEPQSIRYRDCPVLSSGPPSGGMQVLLALSVLEQMPPDRFPGRSDDWYEALAEVTWAVFRDRQARAARKGGKTASADIGRHAREILESMRGPPGTPAPRPAREQPGETTHLCAADAQGNIVALTQSLQSLFGAKVANGKLGFLYNNYLCTLPRRQHPYRIRGGGVPRSNAAPTLVLTGEPSRRPLLVLGAAGSRRITSAIVQVISSVVDRGLTVRQAVDLPRIHATLSGTAHLERPAATDSLLGRLESRFHSVRIRSARSFYMGSVQAIQWNEDASVTGAADPRRDGTAGLLHAREAGPPHPATPGGQET